MSGLIGIDIGKPINHTTRYLHIGTLRRPSRAELTWFYRAIVFHKIATEINVEENAKRDFDKNETDWYFVINDAIGYIPFIECLSISDDGPFVIIDKQCNPFPEQVERLEDRHDD